MSRNATNPNRMPHLPGYYYDVSRNRYFKGTPPKLPPPPRAPLKPTSLPRLLHSTALGKSTTKSRLHAALLRSTNIPTEPVAPTLNPIQQISHAPTDTLACKLTHSGVFTVLTFPDRLLTTYRYLSEFPALSFASYGKNAAYVAIDGVYLHQPANSRLVKPNFGLPSFRTVSLSNNFLLAAGEYITICPVDNTSVPQHTILSNVRDVLSSDITHTSRFALGTRDGRVVLYDNMHANTTFYPSGKRRSVTSLKIRDDLIWCSTMRGGNNLSAWDVRDLRSPAIVCKAHSNTCKMVGMDAAVSLVTAAGDDEKVRVWDIRGGSVLSEIGVKGIVGRVKMVGWTGGLGGGCGVWLDTGDEIYARVVAT